MTPPMQSTLDATGLGPAIAQVLAPLFGYPAADLNADTSFLELGADSLLLMRASRAIEQRFGTTIPFRLLMGKLSTIRALSEHLGATRPAATTPLPERSAATVATSAVAQRVAVVRDAVTAPPAVARATSSVAPSALHDVIVEQLRLMSRQIALLG